MPLSICKKLKLPDLRLTTLVTKLADGFIRHLAAVLEDIPVQVENFVIPCDFIVLDMDESFQAPVILGRPFLATTRTMIDVRASTISFQLCRERVDFCFPPPTPFSLPATPSSPEAPVHTVPPDATLSTTIFYGNGGSSVWPIDSYNAPPPIPIDFGITYVCTAEVVDLISPSYNSATTPPGSSRSIIWR